jgi:hypothetical protein
LNTSCPASVPHRHAACVERGNRRRVLRAGIQGPDACQQGPVRGLRRRTTHAGIRTPALEDTAGRTNQSPGVSIRSPRMAAMQRTTAYSHAAAHTRYRVTAHSVRYGRNWNAEYRSSMDAPGIPSRSTRDPGTYRRAVVCLLYRSERGATRRQRAVRFGQLVQSAATDARRCYR